MTIKRPIDEVTKKDHYVIKNKNDDILQVVFPHQVRIGLYDNQHFGASISGSIHHTNEGISYLVAGDNVTITSSSNGQVTITSSTGSSGTEPTATNHIQPFYLSLSPTGDPTPIFHGKWSDGSVQSFDPEQTASNFIWKYFPYGGEFKKVYGIGDGVGNSSTSNPFTQNAVFAIHKWSDSFISGLSGATAVRPAIFHVTASPGHTYAEESSTYYHRSTYNFDLASGTGSPVINSGDLICITFKGEGTQRDGFQYNNFFVEWEENIS